MKKAIIIFIAMIFCLSACIGKQVVQTSPNSETLDTTDVTTEPETIYESETTTLTSAKTVSTTVLTTTKAKRTTTLTTTKTKSNNITKDTNKNTNLSESTYSNEEQTPQFYDTVIVRSDGKLLDKSKSNSNILILGNSFVGSSQVGQILHNMTDAAQKKVTVNAESRAFYTVERYLKDIELMESIKSGTYDVIFLCGLYSYSDSLSYQSFVNACNQGKAKLVITPAYNESDIIIQQVFQSFPKIAMANWKTLIYKLIDSGISSSYLCRDDQFMHTTVVGGYAGAYLMYLMLFNEKPPSVYEKVMLTSGIDNTENIFQSIESITYKAAH